MTAAPLNGAMPPNMDLPDGYIVEWAAIDPTSGADIASVVVSGVSIFGTLLEGAVGVAAYSPVLLRSGPVG